MKLHPVQQKQICFAAGSLFNRNILTSTEPDQFIYTKGSVRFGDATNIDKELKPRLQQTNVKDDLIKALEEAGDKGSGKLVELIVPFVNTDDHDMSFAASDAIIGMANRGEKEAIETYVDLLLNYGTKADNDIKKEAMIRNLAVTSLMDTELLYQLKNNNLLDRAFDRLREFNVPADLKNKDFRLFQEDLIRSHFKESRELPESNRLFKITKMVEQQFSSHNSVGKLGNVVAKALLGNKKELEKLIEYLDTNNRSNRFLKFEMESLGVSSDQIVRLFFDDTILKQIQSDRDLTIKFHDVLDSGLSENNKADEAYRLLLKAIINKSNARGAFEKASVIMRNGNVPDVKNHMLWMLQELNDKDLFNELDKKDYFNNAKFMVESMMLPEEASRYFARINKLTNALYRTKRSDNTTATGVYTGIEDSLKAYKLFTENVHEIPPEDIENLEKTKKLQVINAHRVLLQLKFFMLRQQSSFYGLMGNISNNFNFLTPSEAFRLQSKLLDKIGEIGDDSNLSELKTFLKQKVIPINPESDPVEDYYSQVLKTVETIGEIAGKTSEDGKYKNCDSIQYLVSLMNNDSMQARDNINAILRERFNKVLLIPGVTDDMLDNLILLSESINWKDESLQNKAQRAKLASELAKKSDFQEKKLDTETIEKIIITGLLLKLTNDSGELEHLKSLKNLRSEWFYMRDVIQNNKPLEFEKISTIMSNPVLFTAVLSFDSPNLPFGLTNLVKRESGKILYRLDDSKVGDANIKLMLEEAQSKIKEQWPEVASDKPEATKRVIPEIPPFKSGSGNSDPVK